MPDQPTRRTRTGLLAAAGAILVAGATAAAVTAAVSPGQPRQYWALPGACSLVTSATLDKYLPGAIGDSSGGPALNAVRTTGCQWYRLNGGQPRTVSMTMTTFASAPSAVPRKSQAASSISIQPRSASVFGTMWTDPEAIKEGARLSSVEDPVPGLGDSAKATLMIVTPAGSGHPRLDGVTLSVVSGNADIVLSTAAIPAAFIHVSPAGAARQFGLIAIAHDVLAALPRA